MITTAESNPISQAIARAAAQAMVEGFDKHYKAFRQCSVDAKSRFEAADWQGIQKLVRERIQFYDERVSEAVERMRRKFCAQAFDDSTWQQTKLYYIDLLTDHKQPELAETFFNSVFCRIRDRKYFNNDFIFFRPAISTEYIQSDPPNYRCYYPGQTGLRQCVRQVFVDFGWNCPFADLDRDVDYIMRTIDRHFGGIPAAQVNCQINVLYSPFYRNKAAYVFGMVVNGHQEYPFAVPVLHDGNGRLMLDTILLDAWRINILFSLSRAYFLVDMEVPSGYVQFLRGIMPSKPLAEIYTMLGLGKHGKTMFIRDLMHHLRHSRDDFIEAPGIRGLVMSVFMLPSYPYVFKVIRDVFGHSKDTDRAKVKSKFLMVKQHDRRGRMADTLEFSELALPKSRFSPELLDHLHTLAPSVIEEEDDSIVIKHLYIERRMAPLNMYLDQATPEQIEHAVRDYGNAIRELAMGNIFPGDLLWKNFGITRYGRVVFYDYDEIEYLTDCNFRRIPPAPYPEMELSGEVWYSVARNDVFPEEFGAFLLGNPVVREAFEKYHSDLLAPEFWQECQEALRRGEIRDFFPYPESVRFQNIFKDKVTAPVPEARKQAVEV
jgi:isocitrate dehydrogenase kinase/phosphatase